MKKLRGILKTTGMALGVTAVSGIAFLGLRHPAMEPPPDMHAEATPERLARGKYLYTLADCDGCHSPRDFSRFNGPAIEGRRGSGTVFPASMGLPGMVAPPNITPDPETGIGTWTDGEKIRAIREGIDRDGGVLFPMMPYEQYRHMSDEDVLSLVAYLDSLPPVNHAVPKTRVNFPVSLLIKGAPQPARHVPEPNRGDKLKYGQYLVSMAGCMDCHTRKLSGGQRFQVAPGVQVVSANISPDLETGIGRWSEQDFVDRISQYRDYVRNGSPQAGPESFTLMPWLNFAQLEDGDLKAIYAYLHSRPAVHRSVETHPGFDPIPVQRGSGSVNEAAN